MNTGRLGAMLDATHPTTILIKNFEKDVQKFVQYKNNCNGFIDAVLAQTKDEVLYSIVKNELY